VDADPEDRSYITLHGSFTGGEKVVVNHDAGYEAVPEDVAQAVVDWVAYRWTMRSFIGLTAKRTAQAETIQFQQTDMPETTRACAEFYRRTRLAAG
jgi:hypothetical protein